jgi:hypothetical protein
MYMNANISVKQDYVMITHNPLTDMYTYLMYHVLDISHIDGNQVVNIQQKQENNTLARITVPYSRFLYLLQTRMLIKLK